MLDGRALGIELAVFAHTVEDDHGGVDGVTDDGKHCGDEGLVNIEVEGQQTVEQSEEADDEDGVVGQRGDAANAETPAAETETDIDEHDQEAADDGEEGIADQVICDGGTHLLRLDDAQGVGLGAAELLLGDFVGEERLGAVVELADDVGIDGFALFVDFILGGDFELGGGTVGLDLGGLAKLLVERGADIDGVDGLVEADHVCAAAREIDTTAQAAGDNADEADGDGGTGDNIEGLALADEVEVGVTHEVFGEGEGEVDLLLVVEHPVETEACDEDGGEERGGDTDAEGDCEALDGTGAEHDEHQAEEEGGHLTVDDGGVGVAETGGYRIDEAAPVAEFLFDTLVDDDVAVNSHGESQHDTGDARHGEDGAHRGKHAHEEEDVGDKSDGRHPAAAVIEENHVDEHDDEGQDEGDKTLGDGLLTERGTDNGFLDDDGGGGEFARLEDVGKVLGLFEGEVAGDGGAAAGNLAVDHGGRIDKVVEDNGHAVADILAGDALPLAGAVAIHSHGNLVAAGIAEILTGIGDDAAVEEGGAVAGVDADGVELVDVGTLLDGLGGPEELDSTGVDDPLLEGGLNHAGDGVAVLGSGIADHGAPHQAALLVDVGHEHFLVEEGVLLGEFVELGIGVLLAAALEGVEEGVALGCSGLVRHSGILLGLGCGGFGLAAAHGGNIFVNLFEHQVGLGILVGQPKLELSSALEELADALGVLHAGQLNEDALGGAELLDGGLRHAELVDTLAQDFVCAVVGTGGLLANHVDNIVVGAVELYLVAKLGVEVGG